MATVCYAGVVLVLMALENRIVFVPTTAAQHWLNPPKPAVRDVTFQSGAGGTIHGWWYPHEKATGALLYCHGNAGNLSHRGNAIVKLHDALGVSVLIIDYPGYGKSDGSPTEAGCYAAADAAYDWLVKDQKIPPERILLYGGSLGGGVAVELASRREHRALILVRTFTSAPDTAQHHYPWLPTQWLMRNRFDALGKIKSCTKPKFIAHGTTDSVIPFNLGERLFEAAEEPKVFLRMNGVEHNDALPELFYRELREFLNRHAGS